MSLSQPIGQALTPKKQNLIAPLMLVLGLIICVGAAAYGYIESRRTERVVIAVRDVPYGQQLSADDLAVIELPLHRPVQLAGIVNPNAVIGRYATREIGTNDVLKATMLADTPPENPVYPNGAELGRDMVPVPFALATLGPITDHDRVNIGFTTTDASLCDRAAADVPAGTLLPPPEPLATTTQAGDTSGGVGPQTLPRAFACRYMSSVRILYIDGATAYLEMTPSQAHSMWALQAAGVAMWGERYGTLSTPLMYMDRLDAGQVILPDLTGPVSETLRVEPHLQSGNTPIPGANTSIPGSATSIPGATPVDDTREP
jgi:hypothetical protein